MTTREEIIAELNKMYPFEKSTRSEVDTLLERLYAVIHKTGHSRSSFIEVNDEKP